MEDFTVLVPVVKLGNQQTVSVKHLRFLTITAHSRSTFCPTQVHQSRSGESKKIAPLYTSDRSKSEPQHLQLIKYSICLATKNLCVIGSEWTSHYSGKKITRLSLATNLSMVIICFVLRCPTIHRPFERFSLKNQSLVSSEESSDVTGTKKKSISSRNRLLISWL
ncbi:hypothetical protein CDAR_57001 [Caerostris darwini]|uniref:Uncharacterized protein n=1 Tax=Caerostris darwini TaxID=1538125 RepID=A0AAV4QD26_9ARAC|nr:hypothetical protein CDAR_57001 [Caerostris darwini]